MKGRTFALLILGWSLLKTLVRRVLPGRPALQQFQEHYASEGVLSVTPREHQVLTLSYACTGCGQCDREEGARITRTRKGYRGLAATVLGGTRSLVDYDAVSDTISEVPDEALAVAEKACPEGVPIVQLVGLIRGHAERVTRLKATSANPA